jgi:sensor histidine kinase YesM
MDSILSRLVLSDEWKFRLTRHTLFWVACTLFFGTIYGSFWRFGTNPPLINKYSFTEAVLYLPLHMFLGYSIIYFLFPRYLFKGKYLQLLGGILLLIFATACLSYLTSKFIINPYRSWQGLPLLVNPLPNGLMAGLRGSNTVAGFVVAIKLLKYWYFKKIENENLEKANLKAELELLKGQLQPHFLFNTLNNLYALILQQSKEAPQVVIKLSELLQYMLKESPLGMVSLEKELNMLQHYMALEKMRFGERLDLTFSVQGPADQKMIAPLILLPFVENTFKHGVSEIIEQPWITMDMIIRKDTLSMKLINGKSEKVNGSKHPASGTGLVNVKKRLDLLYGKQYELKTLDEPETYVVNLTIPLEEK